MQNFTDEQLASLSAKGSKEALETLIARYIRLVYPFVYGYAKNAETAEDITQEVFVKVWKNLKKFDENKTFRPWIYQIAKNTALDFLKKKSLLAFSDINEQDQWLAQNIADTSPLPEAQTQLSFAKKEIALALKKLAPKYSQVISLYHLKELNFREIARATSQPINTIKSRYRRAIVMLRKIMHQN